jgi:16S rRNA (cytidine1402-2'-O)-methyltransferase
MTVAAGARGRLVLMPNTLDLGSGHEVDLQAVLPLRAIERAAGLAHWAVENAKSARAFLKRVDAIVPLAQPLQALSITELPRPRKGGGAQAAVAAGEWAALLAPALQGHDLGLLSEAGLPAVADPGSELVAAAQADGLEIEPWSGPSSLMLALAASGLHGQSFAFVGYLPVEAAARMARIRELEAWSRKTRQTQIAIETPYRNAALLRALVDTLAPGTRLAVASGLTLPGGGCRTRTVAQWRGLALSICDNTPSVFAWQAA